MRTHKCSVLTMKGSVSPRVGAWGAINLDSGFRDGRPTSSRTYKHP